MGYKKVHILVLGVPNNRLTCMQGRKTLSFSNMHLFLPYLLNDFQTIRFNDSFFSKPLLCVTLICSDWSDWSITFKAERNAALCTVATGETAIFNTPKAAPSGNKGAGNMLMFHVDVNMKRLKSRYKNNLFQ